MKGKALRVSCMLCIWQETWSTRNSAQAAVVWHVFNEHRVAWTDIAGHRLPVDPKPDTIGVKL